MRTDLDRVYYALQRATMNLPIERELFDNFLKELKWEIDNRPSCESKSEDYKKHCQKNCNHENMADVRKGIMECADCGYIETTHDLREECERCFRKPCICNLHPSDIDKVECEHDWVGVWNRSLTIDDRNCKKCGKTEWFNSNQYHSGKDALDKLMRGECDRIKFDGEAWYLLYGELTMDIAGNIRSNKYTAMGYESFGQAINQKYFNQTKWLCLKDIK